jgi:hypothetical protein
VSLLLGVCVFFAHPGLEPEKDWRTHEEHESVTVFDTVVKVKSIVLIPHHLLSTGISDL